MYVRRRALEITSAAGLLLTVLEERQGQRGASLQLARRVHRRRLRARKEGHEGAVGDLKLDEECAALALVQILVWDRRHRVGGGGGRNIDLDLLLLAEEGRLAGRKAVQPGRVLLPAMGTHAIGRRVVLAAPDEAADEPRDIARRRERRAHPRTRWPNQRRRIRRRRRRIRLRSCGMRQRRADARKNGGALLALLDELAQEL
mmetsp:Transcript_22401/g.73109  ORF Transcript_22401/g.73109 Transcript_22401/m.73109 type:complete len:202 (+) Transcript_22401:125-730(+)